MMNMANVKDRFLSAVLIIFLAISTTDVQGKSLSLRIVSVKGESPCQTGLIHQEDAFVVTGRVTTENINASDSQRVQFTIVGTNFEATVCTVRLSSCHEQDSSYMGCYCQNTGDGDYDVVLRQKANVQYSSAKVKMDYKDDDFSFEMSSTSWRIPETFYKDTEKLTLEANGIKVDLTSSQCTLPLREGQNTFMYCCSDAPSCDVRITEPDGRESGSIGCYKLTAYGIDESLHYAFSYSVCGVESSQSFTCKGKFDPELFPTSKPTESPPEADDGEESENTGIIVGAVVAAIVVVGIVLFLCYYCRSRHNNKIRCCCDSPPSYKEATKKKNTDDGTKGNAGVPHYSEENEDLSNPASQKTSVNRSPIMGKDYENPAKAEKDAFFVTPRLLPQLPANGGLAANGSVPQASEGNDVSPGRPLPERPGSSGPSMGKGAGSFKASKANKQKRTRPQSGVTFENETPLTSPSLCDISQTHGMNRTPDGSPKPPTSYTAYNLQRASGKMRDMLNGEGNLERAGNSNDQGYAIDIENLNNNHMDNSKWSNVHVDNSDLGSGGSDNNSGIDNNNTDIPLHGGDSGQGSGDSGDGSGIDKDKDKDWTSAYTGQSRDSHIGQSKVGDIEKSGSGTEPQSEISTDESDQKPKTEIDNVDDGDQGSGGRGDSSGIDIEKDSAKVQSSVSGNDQVKVDNDKGGSSTDQQSETKIDRPDNVDDGDQGSGRSGDSSGIDKDKDNANAEKSE